MFDLSKYAIDKNKETQGVWHAIGDGLKLKVARYNNPEYVRKYQELIGPHRNTIKAGTMSEEEKANLAADALSKTVLLDWDGLYIGGKEIPYSTAEAKRILADTRYATFFGWVMDLAQSETAFREVEVARELGES